jgi:preprotein translocase subunit YajC
MLMFIVKSCLSVALFVVTTVTAFADDMTPPPQSSIPFFVMLIVFFLFIYFGVWRPQSKRAKEQQALLAQLAKGDEVMTAGGMLGRITKLNDQYISLAVTNQVEIMIQKSSVVSVLPKGTLGAL